MSSSYETVFRKSIAEHVEIVSGLESQARPIIIAASIIVSALADNKRIYLCGNGGSAADAQHIAAELIGRFKKERYGLPACALTTDTSVLTALSNDYGYDQVYARQVQALAMPGDVLIAISTSGKSRNILEAAKTARLLGAKVIGLSGKTGGDLSNLCDVTINVPSDSTARIQEAHILIGHVWCEIIDLTIPGGDDA